MTTSQLALYAALFAVLAVAAAALAVREIRGRIPDPAKPPPALRCGCTGRRPSCRRSGSAAGATCWGRPAW